MQLIENPMVLNIPYVELPDDVNDCDECGSSQEDVFYVTDKGGEFKGCKSCVNTIDAWDAAVCPVCGSTTCLSLYTKEGEGIFGCDDCVSLVEPVDWYWEKKERI